MDTATVNFLVGHPWFAVGSRIAAALPGAALAYGLVWWAMRPRDGRRVGRQFASHAVGLITTVVVSAVFRVIAIATFGGRSAFDFADFGAAAFYILVIPTIVAATLFAWRNNRLATAVPPDAKIAPKMEHASFEPTAGSRDRVVSSNMENEGEGSVAYGEPLEQIEAGSMAKGVSAYWFAESRGDGSKA